MTPSHMKASRLLQALFKTQQQVQQQLRLQMQHQLQQQRKRVVFQGLRRDSEGCCMWEPCRVFSYDANSNKFHVQWCDHDEEAELLRIELLFKVSPLLFFCFVHFL